MPGLMIKMCGITRPADAQQAADAGADLIGMILHASPSSRRLIDTPTARSIVAALPPGVPAVGVMVDPSAEQARRLATEIDIAVIQLHGDESPATAEAIGPWQFFKAFKVDRVTIRTQLDVWRQAHAAGRLPHWVGLLLESPGPGAGGTGRENDLDCIEQLKADGAFAGLPPLILAGGLTPRNVAGAVARVRPNAVDVSSGIEKPIGQKSPAQMIAFVAAARLRS